MATDRKSQWLMRQRYVTIKYRRGRSYLNDSGCQTVIYLSLSIASLRHNPSLLEHDLCHSDGIYDETDARSGLISFGRSRAFEFENPTKPTNASNTSSRKVSRLSLSFDF